MNKIICFSNAFIFSLLLGSLAGIHTDAFADSVNGLSVGGQDFLNHNIANAKDTDRLPTGNGFGPGVTIGEIKAFLKTNPTEDQILSEAARLNMNGNELAMAAAYSGASSYDPLKYNTMINNNQNYGYTSEGMVTALNGQEKSAQNGNSMLVINTPASSKSDVIARPKSADIAPPSSAKSSVDNFDYTKEARDSSIDMLIVASEKYTEGKITKEQYIEISLSVSKMANYYKKNAASFGASEVNTPIKTAKK